MSEENIWPAFYQKVVGRKPRALLTRALALFEDETPANNPRQAIDIGCGDGTETLAMLMQGWKVLAIDGEPEGIRLLEEKIPAEQQAQIKTQVASFEDAKLIEADFVYAGLSLPFCPPQHFETVWKNLTRSIRTGGCFAGHLFGDRDTWAANPKMTCLTRSAVERLFDGFEIAYLDESEEDSQTALGDPKHWHIFEVVARKIA